MESIFFIGMVSAINDCLAVAYDKIKPFDNRSFDNLVKRNADLDAALNFKADDQHNNNEGVLMRADELEILP
jgi:hypothetical protein